MQSTPRRAGGDPLPAELRLYLPWQVPLGLPPKAVLGLPWDMVVSGMSMNSVTLAAAVLVATAATGCGLCGNEDEVRVTSPDGKHVAYSYLRNCGATVDYVTMVDMETPGRSNGINAYSANGAHELTLRWASPQELHIECRGCPPRHLTAPPIDGVTITVISAVRGSDVVPHL